MWLSRIPLSTITMVCWLNVGRCCLALTTADCVSFKPNSTGVLVQNLRCNGSHGISVGSLGQYQGQVDIVEDVYVYNISMSNASDGARIKIWPGVPPNTTNSEKGGGAGYVRNVTYELFYNDNVDCELPAIVRDMRLTRW